jgi:GntR family transcriptional regulator
MDDSDGPPADEPAAGLGEGPELVYVHVADHIESRIRAGRFPANSRLPGERDLARRYGVSYGSVRRAMAELRDRALVVTVHGRGNYVVRQLPAQRA